MDNLITGRVENIAHLMGNPKFSFIKYNICDYIHMDGQLDDPAHCFSGEPARLTRAADCHPQSRGSGYAQSAGPGKGKSGPAAISQYI